MSKRITLVVALLLTAACEPRVPSDELTIELSRDDDDAVVTAQASLESTAERNAALSGTDPWAVRFARLNAQEERTTFDKSRGTVQRVTHSMRIHRSDLQQVFADTNVTVALHEVEGVTELRFYPGTSTRASRRQQEHFEASLEWWSAAAARYLDALHRLYSYMDANPDRVEPLWAAVLGQRDPAAPVLFEEEQPYVDQLVRSMDEMLAHMDQDEAQAVTLAEEADLIFNPFPARITVKVPNDEKLVIEPVHLLDAVKSLEGHWATPDPLAMLVREEELTPEGLAVMRRDSTLGVRANDIAEELRKRLREPRNDAIRWRD
ncbi:MAG TPA: hypothetical protein VGF28_05605 [Thermoanaerobaculia bacterium]|jgi:hypothetical protein